MALLSIRHLWDDVNLGIWAIEETVEQLFEQYPHLKDLKVYLDEKYKNEGRKKEILAIRALLYEMTHEESSKIQSGRESNEYSNRITRKTLQFNLDKRNRSKGSIMINIDKIYSVTTNYYSTRNFRCQYFHGKFFACIFTCFL